jgi:hypothetical protein
MECTIRSRPPRPAATSPKARSRSASSRTSQATTTSESTDAASFRTSFSSRSPWYVKASFAPASWSACAIAHAMERRLATPATSASFPSSMRNPFVTRTGGG